LAKLILGIVQHKEKRLYHTKPLLTLIIIEGEEWDINKAALASRPSRPCLISILLIPLQSLYVVTLCSHAFLCYRILYVVNVVMLVVVSFNVLWVIYYFI